MSPKWGPLPPPVPPFPGAPDRIVGRVGGYVQRRSRDTFLEVGTDRLPSRRS